MTGGAISARVASKPGSVLITDLGALSKSAKTANISATTTTPTDTATAPILSTACRVHWRSDRVDRYDNGTAATPRRPTPRALCGDGSSRASSGSASGCVVDSTSDGDSDSTTSATGEGSTTGSGACFEPISALISAPSATGDTESWTVSGTGQVARTRRWTRGLLATPPSNTIASGVRGPTHSIMSSISGVATASNSSRSRIIGPLLGARTPADVVSSSRSSRKNVR
ncbi:unannotated protein [freshwater metagenome]|uniref:Unannotated protein n=1 Tax=freshwater metagenome TaxID=449393 RepID=A0A6J7FQ02_9ZZZZ